MRSVRRLLLALFVVLVASCRTTGPVEPKNMGSWTPDEANGTAADIDIDFNTVIGRVSVCQMQRVVWSAKSQTKDLKSAVEPAWIALFDPSISKPGLACISLYPAPDPYLDRASAKPAVPAPISRAEFLLIQKGLDAANASLAPLVVRGPELNGGKSSLCFALNDQSGDPATVFAGAEIQIRYAIKSKSSTYSNCAVEVSERETGEVLRSLRGNAGGNAATGEVWVTRAQLENLFVEARMIAKEVCYSSNGLMPSDLDQTRTHQLLPLILPSFRTAKLPIGEALAKATGFPGENAGARLTSYLAKKSDELKTRRETTFDGSNEIEANALGLVSGSNRLKLRIETVADDLRKTNSELAWTGEFVLPPSLDVFLLGRVGDDRQFTVSATRVAVVGDKIVQTVHRVPIFNPVATTRHIKLTPPPGDKDWGNKNWSDSYSVTLPNERIRTAKYDCKGPACPWSYAVNRSRPICVTLGPQSHQCEYEDDFVISEDGKKVTVYRQTNPNQYPSHEYDITIDVLPASICSGESSFIP